MKEKFQCEVCKNYHDTPEAANSCESQHLLPVSVKARRYDPESQAPGKVEVLFDNKLGGYYGAMYRFLCWLDKDEEDNGQFHETAQNLITEQLRRENENLRFTNESNQSLIDSLHEIIKKQANDISELKKAAPCLCTPDTDNGYSENCSDATEDTQCRIEYTFTLGSRDIAFSGCFTVNADNYSEAYEKASEVFYEHLTLPGTLSLNVNEDNFFVVKTNAGELLEENLRKCLSQYSTENIDIVYDEERGEYCIKYHSDNDSFSIYGIDSDEFFFEDGTDPEEWLVALADKYNVGYCF